MKCRLHNPNHDLERYWVDWSRLQPLWERNTFHALSPSKLTLAYHALWFADIDGPRSHFKIGAIWYQQQSDAIMFTNGRHRTLLLSTLIERIPIAIDDDALQHPDVAKALLDPVKPYQGYEVIGIFPDGDGAIAVIGLAHMDIVFSVAVSLDLGSDGHWILHEVARLPTVSSAVVQVSPGVYAVRSGHRVTVFNRTRILGMGTCSEDLTKDTAATQRMLETFRKTN